MKDERLQQETLCRRVRRISRDADKVERIHVVAVWLQCLLADAVRFEVNCCCLEVSSTVPFSDL